MQKSCISISRACFFTLILMSGLIFSTLVGHAEEKAVPFYIGEEINYTVSWEMIRAGKAKVSVLPFTTIKGEKAFHFLLEAKSTRYVDLLYKLRLRMEGFTDEQLTRSLLHRKLQSGKEKKDVTILFDWENKTAAYSNFGEKIDPIQIPLKTVDPLSAFFRTRTIDFETGQDLSFPVTDGKKCFTQTGSVVTREKITLPSGTFDTYVLVPQVKHFSGVFKKSKNPTVKLWVTADDKKIPVRIKIKVFIGSIIIDLVSVR